MDDVFPDRGLWPVRLVLPHRAGWSLWGGDTPDGSDFLLPAGRRYALRDLGAQFDDPVLTGLSTRPGLLRHLYDVLWGDTADDADPDKVADAAQQAVTRVAELACWNPG